MKLITKPREYEAIQFNGITQEVLDFIEGSDARIYKVGEVFTMSNIVGNHDINIGDYLYRVESPVRLISIARNDDLLEKFFEVVK